MKPDINLYLESWSEELKSRGNRVRSLIGDAHWLSDGHHKEELLRDFLCRYLPNDLEIKRGFIKTSIASSVCSPEVDILITQPRKAIPYFMESGLQIVHPDSVLAHIEVKSTFAQSNLQEALQNITRTKRTSAQDGSIYTPWSGIIFYSIPGSRTPDSVAKTIEASLKKTWAAIQLDTESSGGQPVPFAAPTCIVIDDTYIVFFKNTLNDKPEQPQEIQFRLFGRSSLCLACGLADLFGFVNEALHVCGTDVFRTFVESVDFTHKIVRSVVLQR